MARLYLHLTLFSWDSTVLHNCTHSISCAECSWRRKICVFDAAVDVILICYSSSSYVLM